MNKTLEIIESLEKERNQMNISRESIDFISLVLISIKPRNTLEIGAFNGYSALWLSLFSKKVVSLEIDKISFNTATKNLKEANCKNVKLIQGDARNILKKLKTKFDFILIDGKKSEYKEYLELSLKLLNKKGLILVDNTISHKEKLDSFFSYLNKSDLFFKESGIGKGLMIVSKNQSSLTSKTE